MKDGLDPVEKPFGRGNKGGSKGGGGARTPVEALDNLVNDSTLYALHVVSEGEIEGWADPDFPGKCIFFDGVPLQNDDNSFNFTDVQYWLRTGTADQEPVPGFSAVESEVNVGLKVEQAQPVTESITDVDVDAVRVKISVNNFSSLDTVTGDVSGTSVQYQVLLQVGAGAFYPVVTGTMDGKTTSGYQRGHRIELPSERPVNIRVERLTADSDSSALNNDIYFASMTEIIDAKLRYSETAFVAMAMPASVYGGSLPTVTFKLKGMLCLVPSNYDPVARTYDESTLWDGTFVRAFTSNPAFFGYTVFTDDRWGLGDRIRPELVDKWSTYQIGKYCDRMVDDGYGGFEPCMTINGVINERQGAYDVITQLSSIWRGTTYWGAGAVVPVQDAPADATKLVVNANIEGGNFKYSSTAIDARKTVGLAAYRHPDDHYKIKSAAFHEDQAGVRRFGYRELDIRLPFCASRGEALRTVRWHIDTALTATETVQYIAGFDHASVRPFDIIKVADKNKIFARTMGRAVFVFADGLGVHLDAPVKIEAGEVYTLLMTDAVGKIVERVVTTGATVSTAVLEFAEAVPVGAVAGAVLAGSVFALNASNVAPREFRVLSNERKDFKFHITGLEHDAGKYARVEDGLIAEVVEPYTLPPVGNPVAPLSVDATVFLKPDPGSISKLQLLVAWPAHPDPRVAYHRMQVKEPGRSWRWVESEFDEVSAEVAPLRDALGTYEVRLFAQTLDGKLSGYVTGSVDHTVASFPVPAVPVPWVAEVGHDVITLIGTAHPSSDVRAHRIYGATAISENLIALDEVDGTTYVRRPPSGGAITRYKVTAVTYANIESDDSLSPFIAAVPTGVPLSDLQGDVTDAIASAAQSAEADVVLAQLARDAAQTHEVNSEIASGVAQAAADLAELAEDGAAVHSKVSQVASSLAASGNIIDGGDFSDWDSFPSLDLLSEEVGTSVVRSDNADVAMPFGDYIQISVGGDDDFLRLRQTDGFRRVPRSVFAAGQRSFRFSCWYRYNAAALTAAPRIRFILRHAGGTNFSGSDSYVPFESAVADQWAFFEDTFTDTYDGGEVEFTDIMLNFPGVVGQQIDLAGLSIVDVTDSVASGVAAAASLLSEQTAAAHVVDGQEAAAAAQLAEVGAETAEAGASVAELSAAQSATDASGSASAAAAERVVSADAADDAENFAAAASGSADIAEAHATDAGQSALSSSSDAVAAGVSAGQASVDAAAVAVAEQTVSGAIVLAQAAQAASARVFGGGLSNNPVFSEWSDPLAAPDNMAIALSGTASFSQVDASGGAKFLYGLRLGTGANPTSRPRVWLRPVSGSETILATQTDLVEVSAIIELVSGQWGGCRFDVRWHGDGIFSEQVYLKDDLGFPDVVGNAYRVNFLLHRPADYVAGSDDHIDAFLYSSTTGRDGYLENVLTVSSWDIKPVSADSVAGLAQTAVATLDGYSASVVALRAQAGSGGAVLELSAIDDAESGPRSTARIAAADIVLEGSVRASELTIDDKLEMDDAGAAFLMGKASAVDGADGIFMGRSDEGGGVTGFGFAAGRVDGDREESISITKASGLTVKNADYFSGQSVITEDDLDGDFGVQTFAFAATTTSVTLQMIAGGGGGGGSSTSTDNGTAGGDGADAVFELLDDGVVVETWSLTGGDGGGVNNPSTLPADRQASGAYHSRQYPSLSTPSKVYGRGGNGGPNTSNNPVAGFGGASGELQTVVNYDISGMTNVTLRLTVGAGDGFRGDQGVAGDNTTSTVAQNGDRAGVFITEREDTLERVHPMQMRPTAYGSFNTSSSGNFPQINSDRGFWVVTNLPSGTEIQTSDTGEVYLISGNPIYATLDEVGGGCSFFTDVRPSYSNSTSGTTVHYYFYEAL